MTREQVMTRNRPVHAYFDVDPVILWSTIREDLPPLVEPLTRLLVAGGGPTIGEEPGAGRGEPDSK